MLLAALAQLEPDAPRSGLRCYSFGSPPVLAHASGAGGDAVLQACCTSRRAQHTCHPPVILAFIDTGILAHVPTDCVAPRSL